MSAAPLVVLLAVLVVSLALSVGRALRARPLAAPAPVDHVVRLVVVVAGDAGDPEVAATAEHVRGLAGRAAVLVGSQPVGEIRDWAAAHEVEESEVVVGVVRPGERLSPGALPEVAGHFADAATGAVQTAARIDSPRGWLDLVDDLDLTLVAAVASGRAGVGALGFGGGGQFLRASDLGAAGMEAWPPAAGSGSDLVVGARMAEAGRVNRLAATASVLFPPAGGLREVMARRHRWARAHTAAWRESRRVSEATGGERPGRRMLLARGLTVPLGAVVAGPASMAVIAVLAVVASRTGGGSASSIALLAALAYLLLFGLAPVHAVEYWLRGGGPPLGRSMVVAHLHALVALVCVPAVAAGLIAGLTDRA